MTLAPTQPYTLDGPTALTARITAPGRIGDLPLTPTAAATEDLSRGLRALQESRPKYEEAEKYYRAKNPELFGHWRIARALARTANRYKLNYAKTPVNALAERLKISSVIVSDNTDEEPTSLETEHAPTASTEAESSDLTRSFRKDIWVALKLQRKTKELHKWVSVYGDAYWFVWTKSPDDSTPVIYYNSPLTTRVLYEEEHPDTPAFAIKCWTKNRTKYAILYYVDQIEYYIQKRNATEATLADGTAWDLYDVVENPFNRIPIFHFRNSDPYGTPEHIDGYGAQDAINKLSTTMVHTSEYEGFPQRFQLTDPNAELAGDSNDNDGWDDETTHSDRANEVNDNDAANESGPGTILTLKARAAGQFQVADPDAFLKPLEFYIHSMSQLTTTPLRFFETLPSRPNGEAARADEAPFVEKVKDRQAVYEDTYVDAFGFAFALLNDEDPTDEPYAIDVRWGPAVSIEDALGWDTVKKKVEAGVPRRVALIEAGYPVDQVDSWLKANEDKMTLNTDIRTLETLSLAIRNLSGAGTLTDNESLAKALALVLTRLLGEKVDPPDPSVFVSPPPTTAPTNPADPNRNPSGLPPTNQPTPPTQQTNDDKRTPTGADDITQQRDRSGR
jgi:hypothetical protein